MEDHLSFIRHPQIEAFYFMEQGIVYQEEGTYDRAISSFLKALAGYKALRDSIGVQKRLNNIGMGYWRSENLEKALEYYLQALDMAERREDETEAATMLGNVDLVYKAQKEYDQALDHYQRSMAI